MKVQYGWVIVAIGALMSCVAVGAMMSLAVFLQPITEATDHRQIVTRGTFILVS